MITIYLVVVYIIYKATKKHSRTERSKTGLFYNLYIKVDHVRCKPKLDNNFKTMRFLSSYIKSLEILKINHETILFVFNYRRRCVTPGDTTCLFVLKICML